MGRKPGPAWTLADVIELFNSAPERTLTKRQLMRTVNAWRDLAAFEKLIVAIVAPETVGSKAVFEIVGDPKTRQVVIKMLDRGY